MAVVQIEQSLVKYLASMSSASNTFEQRTLFHIVTMVMLKYAVKLEARPSYKPSNLPQQNIEVAQKSDADGLVNQTFFAQALIDYNLQSISACAKKVWFTRLDADASSKQISAASVDCSYNSYSKE